MSRMLVAQLLGIDWTAIGVIGGGAYAVYQTVTTGQIRNGILELNISLQKELASLRQSVAVNYEKHATLAGSVKELQDQILQLHKDIAFRDGVISAKGGDPRP